MSDGPGFDPRFDSAFQRGYEPPVQPARPPEPAVAAPETLIGSLPERPEPTTDELLEDEPIDDVRGVNPYVVALWVIAVACVVGGPALLFGAIFQGNGSEGPSIVAQTFQMFAYIFPAPLFTVGLGTIAGLIFLSSVRSSRRRRNRLP